MVVIPLLSIGHLMILYQGICLQATADHYQLLCILVIIPVLPIVWAGVLLQGQLLFQIVYSCVSLWPNNHIRDRSIPGNGGLHDFVRTILQQILSRDSKVDPGHRVRFMYRELTYDDSNHMLPKCGG